MPSQGEARELGYRMLKRLCRGLHQFRLTRVCSRTNNHKAKSSASRMVCKRLIAADETKCWKYHREIASSNYCDTDSVARKDWVQ